MFGVVPKPLWERRIAADERNRIQLGMRCLLVEHDSGLVLIDTGLGNKEDEKFRGIYGVENAGADGRTWLEDGLGQLGATPNDIALVINTHLHFDHAGGDTFVDAGGVVQPTFPRARYVVRRGEYEFATHTNERTGASYLRHNFAAIVERGGFDFVDDDREIVGGIRVVHSPGHVPHHQSVLLTSDGEQALFLGDVVPTSAHVPLPWIMGYDVEPMVTLESKRRLLSQAADEHWLLIFEHDPTVEAGYLTRDGKGYGLTAS
jgi:glyoxylase-like metal-dependent hydrolase (beta-lactamase superfamily II)